MTHRTLCTKGVRPCSADRYICKECLINHTTSTKQHQWQFLHFAFYALFMIAEQAIELFV